MLDALEVRGQVLELPGSFNTDLLPLSTATRTDTLFWTEFVNDGLYRQILEGRQITPSLTAANPAQLALGLRWLRIRRNIAGFDRLCRKRFGKLQQQLSQLFDAA
jgi:hypothetical protein